MTDLTGETFELWRAGGIGLLSMVIRVARAVTPRSNPVFRVWQGMRYFRDMSSGRGKSEPLDNDCYGRRSWTTATDVLAP